MRVAVFGDAHGHAEALDAVIAAAEAHGARGAVVARRHDRPRARIPSTSSRARASAARVALMGNHDYGATGVGRPGPVRRARLAARCARSSSPASAWSGADSTGCARASPRPAATACSAGTAARATPCTSTSAHPTPPHASPPSAPRSASSAHARRGRLAPDAARRARRRGSASASRSISRRQVAAEPRRGRRARRRRGSAGSPTSTARRPTARSGCCSTSTSAPRPGGARPTTPRRRGGGRAPSGSTTPSRAQHGP